MAKKTDQKKRNIIIIAVAAIVAVIAIIIAVILINRASLDNGSFFVSDNTKLVIPLISGDRISADEDEPMPDETYFVYYYQNNDITDLKVYQKYASEAKAKEAYNYYKNTLSTHLKNIEIDGRHVIVTHMPEEYEGITTEDVRRTIEYNKQFDDEDELDDEDDLVHEDVDIVEEKATE
ncbi:hypothetical protein IKE98_02580 [Candidatus Saccharibacteria bacterium]|nr:hypothetical protein [Candidatus Saccharibacteria bacterium]